MAENMQLLRPAAGQASTVPVGPDARLEFTFDQGGADLGKDGQNLVFTFDDGAKLTLEGFYDNFGDDKQPPTFVVAGQDLPGEQFLAALNNPDLMPAAGPAASPLLGGGAYEDALLSGVGGVDRLDKLAFDGWGRATEAAEAQMGVPAEREEAPEQPGGTFELSGNSYDMNGMFIQSGMYEDWRPNQHTGDYDTKLLGRLDFTFKPSGTTVVDNIHLSGFDRGTTIVIGTPQFDAEGNITNGIVVSGPGQVFDFTMSDFNSGGVYVMPPPNSDHDMDISVSLDMHAQSSGVRGNMQGHFTIIVDAVADQPFVKDADFSEVMVGGTDTSEHTTKTNEYDKKGSHVTEHELAGTENVSVTIGFETTVKFGDYEDNSESHFVLIEVPTQPAGAVWACADQAGNPVGTITGPDGKEYFQVPVNNADIASGNGDITVNVNLTVAGDSATVTDTDMNLKVGAMAVENPDDQELTLENNISFDWKDGGADLRLDVVDGGLKITTGWASEGNNDAKHLGGASDGYQYTGTEAAATGNEADGKTNIGAPISIHVGLGSDGSQETISSVDFTYNASEGHLFQWDGAKWTDLDPAGSGKVTVDGNNSSTLDNLVYRPNTGSYSDADVDLGYTVHVQNAAGATGHYAGHSTIVVDAVADLSAAVDTTLEGKLVDDGTKGEIIAKDSATHDKQGWETDTFSVDYSKETHTFTMNVSTSFPDMDGSEKHYILVEKPAGNNWTLDPLPEGFRLESSSYTTGGKTYYQIEVDYKPGDSGDVSLKVDFSGTGIKGDVKFGLMTGSLAVEANGSGREFDMGNNAAVRTDGTKVTYESDLINSTLTVKTGWASEGNNDAKHLGATSDGYRYTGAENVSTGNEADGKTNIGAPITFNLAGGVGSGEYISQVTFEFDASRGSLSYSGPGSLADNGNGTFTLNLPGTNSSVSGLYFVPATRGEQAYNDADVAMKYDVTVKNTDGSTHSFSGTSTVILDAVADKPTNVEHGGVSYHHYTDQPPAEDFGPTPMYAVDAPDTDDTGGGRYEETTSATWGSKIDFTTKATFHDITDGSEKHYIFVEAKPGWRGYGMGEVEGEMVENNYGKTVVVNGVTYYVIDVNEVIHDAVDNYTPGSGLGLAQQGEIFVEVKVEDGQYHAEVTVNVHLQLPVEAGSGSYDYMTKDGSVDVRAGGFAVEGAINFDAAGKGTVDVRGSVAGNAEYDTANNTSLTTTNVTVDINVVTTQPVVTISEGAIYENLTPEAHKGDYTRSPGATITLAGLAEGEKAEITFTFDFKCPQIAGSSTFSSVPGHEDDSMRLEITETLSDGSTVTKEYVIDWNPSEGKWTCTVPVSDLNRIGTDSDISKNPVEIIFKPGYNNNSTDIEIDYSIKVTDPLSGDVKNWTVGDTPALPQLEVLVDAVAQRPDVSDDTSSHYLGTGGTDAFVGGGTVDIGLKVEFQDFTDGSERHYVLAEAQVGWQPPDNTLTIVDANGDKHDVTVTWIQQMIDNGDGAGARMYFKAEIFNDDIQDYGQGLTGGEMEIHIKMQSPGDVAKHVDIRVGGGSWEDKDVIDGEIRWDNNSAFDFKQIGMEFRNVGDISLKPDGWVYENDTPNAHGGVVDTVGADGLHHGGITLTLTAGNADDFVDNFHFTNYAQIYADGGRVYFNGAEINADGSIPGNPTLHGGEQFTFIPGHNYSDNDLRLNYSGTITDPHSGDSKVPGHIASVMVDAVAQLPTDIGHDDHVTVGRPNYYEGPGAVYPTPGTQWQFTVNVSATFEDYTDNSESHYILVQALPNMKPVGATETYSVYDEASKEYTTYWKMPVSNADIAAGNGKASLAVTYEVFDDYHRAGHVPPSSIKVGALAVEHPTDQELTYHNNFAFADGGSVPLEGWGNGDPWHNTWGIVVADGYENDQPNAHLGDDTPAGGALVYFGSGENGDTITSAEVEWDETTGYFIDNNGVKYENGTATLNPADGPFKFVPIGHGDEDVRLEYTTHDSSGASHSGATTIIIDAVANKPTDLNLDAVVDYGKDGLNVPYTAMGKPDGHGNDGDVKIHVDGRFEDNDGSEKHYALVEAQPGWDVPGGEMVYLDGKAYYRVEMEKNPDGAYKTDADGKQYADVRVHVSHPELVGSGGHDLKTGLMAEEQNYGSAGNLETRTDNNVSWTLGGNAHIETSFVDSTVSVSVPSGIYEGGNIPVSVNYTLGANDEFHSLTISAQGEGRFVITYHPAGTTVNGMGLNSAGNPTASSIEALDALKNGTVKITYVPDEHSDKDVQFSWNATFSDTKSGDQETFGARPYTIVDAVANAPTIGGVGFESDSHHLAAQIHEGANVTTTLHFDDVDGSELHYAVLQQGGVWLCDKALVNGVEYPITTIFTQGGTPCYAVQIPDAVLQANGNNVDVTWHVTAPNVTHDVTANLKAGGISVETTTGAGADADKELTLLNNWAENIQDTPVRIGVFDTKGVELSKDGAIREDGDGVKLFLQNPDAGTNEIITQTELTFTQIGAGPGDVIGTARYNGTDYPVTAGADGVGHVIINFGTGGYNPAYPITFTVLDSSDNPTHNSGQVTVIANSTVKDVYLDESHDFSSKQTFDVLAVADRPTDVEGSGPTAAVGSGQQVSIEVSAKFVDLDGSEQHYVLVEAKPGWVCSESKGFYTDADGTKYFKVEVDGKTADVTKSVSLTAPDNRVVGDHSVDLKVGGLAAEKAAGSDNTNGFTPGGTAEVKFHDDGALTLSSNNPPAGVVEGGELSFTLALTGQGGKAFTADAAMSVTLKLTGAGDHPAEAADLKLNGWADQGDGSYTLTLTLPAGSSSVNLAIPVVKDGILEHTEGVRVEVAGSSVPSSVTAPVNGDGYTVNILDSDSAGLVIEPMQAMLVEGETLGFEMKLQNAQGEAVTAVEPMAVSFIVSGVTLSGEPLELEPGLFSNSAGSGSAITWTYNAADHTYSMTATLLPGHSSLTVSADAALSGGEPGCIHAEGIRFEVSDMNTNGLPLTAGGENITVGTPIEFTVQNEDFATVALHGIGAEAIGMELQQVDSSHIYDGRGETGDQVILGTDGNDVIYGSPGNDILVGGGGSDTFVWDNMNMGGTDTIKNFDIEHDHLRFDNLFGGSQPIEAQESLESLLGRGEWDPDTRTFTATDDDSGARIVFTLTPDQAAATLTVAYSDAAGAHTQDVQLQFDNFSFQPSVGNEGEHVAQMLEQIIKVGG